MNLLKAISKDIIIAALIIGLIVLGIHSFRATREFKQFSREFAEYSENVEAKLVDAENRVYEGIVFMESQNSYIQSLLDTVEHLRNVKSYTKIVTKTKIDSVLVPYEVPVYITQPDGDYLKLPQRFSKIDEWYALSGTIKKDEILFDSLSYQNEFSITIGEQDHGTWGNIFKRNKTVVHVRDNNPYTTTKSISSILIEPKTRPLGIGFSDGYGMTNKGLSPYVGIGLNYTFIRF